MSRFGTPMQTVLVLGAAVAATMPAHGIERAAYSCANTNGAEFDRPKRAPKSHNWPHGGGYAKQRREARKRRRQR